MILSLSLSLSLRKEEEESYVSSTFKNNFDYHYILLVQ